MILSTKITYSVRALSYLAKYGTGEGFISLTEISEAENISLNYLAHLFSKLRSGGLIESIRGRRGGYRLARLPEEICLLDVIAAIEMEDFLNLNLPDDIEDHSSCRMVTDMLWSGFDKHVHQFLTRTTLATVLEEVPA